MAGKPVKIAILADSREAVRGFDKAGDAAKDAGSRFDSVAESSDNVASKGSQAAGALSGLGDLVGGKFGAAMQTGGIAMQAAADSGDLLNVITESAIVRKVKDTAVTVAQTTATIAKSAADKAAAGAARIWAGAQWAVNAAMSANPIGLVVVAIVALVAVVVLIATKSKWMRGVLSGVWDGIRSVVTGAVTTVVRFVKAHWPLLLAIITGPIGLAVLAISRHWTTIKNGASAAWTAITGTVRNGVGRVVDFAARLPGRIIGLYANAGKWLWNAGRQLIQGLIDGIDAMIGKVKSKLSGLTNLIPKVKGPPARDRKLLRGAGELIMDGFIKAIDSRVPRLKKTLTKVTATVKKYGPTGTAVAAGSLSASDAPAAVAGDSAAAPPIVINVTGALDPNAVAQQIVQLIVRLARSLGTTPAALLGAK
jgi:phage-related protein